MNTDRKQLARQQARDLLFEQRREQARIEAQKQKRKHLAALQRRHSEQKEGK